MKIFSTLMYCTTVISSAIFSTASWAQVSVQNPWVRATVPQQQATGAFFNITSAQAARLVQVQSPVSDLVEIHEMQMQGNVMKMRAVSGVDLPAGKAVEFKPGGYHVMLLNLKQQAKEGSAVPLTLVVEVIGKDGVKKRETVLVSAPVRALNSATHSTSLNTTSDPTLSAPAAAY